MFEGTGCWSGMLEFIDRVMQEFQKFIYSKVVFQGPENVSALNGSDQ